MRGPLPTSTLSSSLATSLRRISAIAGCPAPGRSVARRCSAAGHRCAASAPRAFKYCSATARNVLSWASCLSRLAFSASAPGSTRCLSRCCASAASLRAPESEIARQAESRVPSRPWALRTRNRSSALPATCSPAAGTGIRNLSGRSAAPRRRGRGSGDPAPRSAAVAASSSRSADRRHSPLCHAAPRCG